MSKTKTDCYFIVNPRAGSGRTMYEWLPAERRLEQSGVSFVTALTDYKRHATSLAYEAAASGYRRIYAVGGDGSVHEVFNGICAWCLDNGVPTEDFTIGVVPIGSGNDWIKSLGVPNDADEAIGLICRDVVSRMDVIEVRCGGGKRLYMANIGGVGFDSHVCQRVNLQKESGKRGKLIYLNALRHTILGFKSIDVCLVADGEVVFNGPCYSLAFGNGRYSGSGMRQVPLAVTDDGLLDYAVIPRLSLGKIVRELPRLYRGNLNKSRYVLSGRCRELQVVPMNEHSSDLVELDGEIEGRLPMTLSVTGRMINVVAGSASL